jgi:N-formylglutamate deformylase
MTTFILHYGTSPLLINIPHAGTRIPNEMNGRFSEAGLVLEDTDWYVDRLYDFAVELGASILVATHSRYVIDLNRAPDGAPLYPGADETELCPTTNFNWQPLYQEGQGLRPGETEERLNEYWRPYHSALQSELERIHAEHGHAILWDAHSIHSRVPRFFEGRLPDYNFGTGGGSSCDPALGEGLLDMAGELGLEAVLDQRFKGGYITRHYGNPALAVHALQLELTWRNYMAEEPPFTYDENLANPTRLALKKLLAFGRDFTAV